MIINVKVTTTTKQNLIIPRDDKNFKVYLTSPPERDKANKKLIELLCEYFHVATSQIRILRGQHCRNKIIEIDNE